MNYVKTFFCYLFAATLFSSSLFINDALLAAGKPAVPNVEKSPKKKAVDQSKPLKGKQKASGKPTATPGTDPEKIERKVALKKSKLSPVAQASVRQANLGFKDCQATALGSMKGGTISPKEFKVQITTCRERYPGAGLYVQCKKKAVKQFSNNADETKAAIVQCKKFLVAAAFDPSEILPFFAYEEKLYFAGIGMNMSQSVTDFSPPNFDCSKLKEKVEDPKQAEHILFGNHPIWFSKLRGKTEPVILKLLKANLPIPPDGQYIDKFGRIFGDPTKPDATVFFPSSSCVFSSELGSYFSGLTTYFLIDSESKAVTPYFAIAFYKPELSPKIVSTPLLVDKLLASLGEGYSASSPDGQRTVLSLEKITKFDEDGDPRDLCKVPRKHKLVAIVKSRSAGSQEPEFVLVANVSQLCEYGDRLSRRL
jgi:hypothetical protein